MWTKSTGELTDFDNKQKEKSFNVVRVTSDDQEYDYVEKENEDATPMADEDNLNLIAEKESSPKKESSPEKQVVVPEPDKKVKKARSARTKASKDKIEIPVTRVLRPRKNKQV